MSGLAMIVCVGLLGAASDTTAPTTPVLGKIKTGQASSSSPRVIWAPRSAAEAAMVIRFDTGSIDDGTAHGLTRMTQNWIVDEAEDGDLRKLIYEGAGSIRIVTGVRFSEFHLVAPSSSFTKLAGALVDAIFREELSTRHFERARDRTLSDRLQHQSEHDLFSTIAGQVITFEGGDNGGEYTNPLFGSASSLHAIDAAQLKAHRDKHFAPARATIAIAGKYKSRALQKTLAKLRGGKARPPKRPAIPKQERRLERVAERGGFALAYLVDLGEGKDLANALILSALLQDELRSLLLVKPAVAEISVDVVQREWTDLIVVRASNAPSVGIVTRKAVDGFRDAVLRDFSDARLKLGKRTVLDGMRLVDNRPAQLAAVLVSSRVSAARHGAAVVDAVNAVSVADFTERVDSWLSKDSATSVFSASPTRAATTGAP